MKKQLINTKDKSKIIEMIDIGGNSLIRAAVKNYLKTLIITDPNDYENFIKNFLLNKHKEKNLLKKLFNKY